MRGRGIHRIYALFCGRYRKWALFHHTACDESYYRRLVDVRRKLNGKDVLARATSSPVFGSTGSASLAYVLLGV